MNIGSRIQHRLQELHWERRDLLERVPDLTPQALSNLIKRDSKRSEWDEANAAALGVSVLWLVYGKDGDGTSSTHSAAQPRATYATGSADTERLVARLQRIDSQTLQGAKLISAIDALLDLAEAQDSTLHPSRKSGNASVATKPGGVPRKTAAKQAGNK